VIDVGDRMETIVRMMASHRSQFFEWLPYNERRADEVPQAEADRSPGCGAGTNKRSLRLPSGIGASWWPQYGPDRGRKIEYCEVFEISEYAAPLDEASRQRLFWFIP